MEARTILGIDAAWTPTQPSGVALLREESPGWRCLALAPSYDAFLALAHGEQVNWDSRPSAAAVSAAELLSAAATLAGGIRPSVVAVDMPISRELITARRPCDDEVSRKFGKWLCAVHSPSTDRPGKVGQALTAQLAAEGYPIVTGGGSAPALIEVYPHPAIVMLLSLEKRLEHKVAKAGRYWRNDPSADPRQNLLSNLGKLLDGLRVVIAGIDLEVPTADSARSLAQFKALEDALDALVCAWVGGCYLRGEAVALGDNGSAAIWVPDRPTGADLATAKAIRGFTA
jgi:predicted RNase H-like nuclease